MMPEEIESTVPILEFNYKFSALSAKYEVEKRSKFHFFLEVFAVVGALLTFFNLVNSYSNSLYQSVSSQ
jgi:hypothetical protein